MLWVGAIADIPAGWVICDGNNGTPDLRNRFIVGSGDTYAIDDTGGATTHTHTGTTDVGDREEIFKTDVTINNGNLKTHVHTFTTDAGSSLPPYYSLAYIMKL